MMGKDQKTEDRIQKTARKVHEFISSWAKKKKKTEESKSSY